MGTTADLLRDCSSNCGASFALPVSAISIHTHSLVPRLSLLALERKLAAVNRHLSIWIVGKCLFASLPVKSLVGIASSCTLVPLLEPDSYPTSLARLLATRAFAHPSVALWVLVVHLVEVPHLDSTDPCLALRTSVRQ